MAANLYRSSSPLLHRKPVITDRTRADHVSSVYQSSNSPIVLDRQALPRKYKLFRGSNSIYQLWTKWVFGLGGGPSVEALDGCLGRAGGPAARVCSAAAVGGPLT